MLLDLRYFEGFFNYKKLIKFLGNEWIILIVVFPETDYSLIKIIELP